MYFHRGITNARTILNVMVILRLAASRTLVLNRAGVKIFCDLFLASDNDRKLSGIAKSMKKSGKIRNFRWASLGRFVIIFSDGKSKAYDRAEELEEVANTAAL